MVSRLALATIYAYQQWLSPHKGFRCAHSVLHGGTGCSGFAKYAIRDHGFFGALPDIRQRFAECRMASQTLRANCRVHGEDAGDDDRPPSKRPQKQTLCDKYDCMDAGCYSCGNFACLPFSFCSGASAATESASSAPDGGCGPDCSADCGGAGCDCSPSCG